MNGPYYAVAASDGTNSWYMWDNSDGERCVIATGMSERTARRVARLLNADEERT